MAASRASGRSRAAAMQGSSGQAAATFPARRSPETVKAGAAALGRHQASPAGRLPACWYAPKGFIGSLFAFGAVHFFVLKHSFTVC